MRRAKKVAFWCWGAIALFLSFCFALTFGAAEVPYGTVVEAADGELLGARVASDGQWRFPAADNISQKYFTALLAYEDGYFHYHPGVNPVSVVRALRQNIRAGKIVSGGSTLTMQLARIERGSKRRSYALKLLETCHAVGLELRYGKRRILSEYAAKAPFGGNTVGVEAAAWRYFRHSPVEMSWAEAATLAVLPNSPAALHPGRNREQLKAKRDRLLETLCRKGVFDRTTLEMSVIEPLPQSASAIPQSAPHLVSAINRTESGQRVTTTIDAALQREVQHTLGRWSGEFAQNNINNQAALIIDIPTGGVLAYCGNATPEKGAFSDDVDIVQARRSTGSLLKPVLYAAMLQDGKLLPTMLLPDIPTYINGFSPKNFHQNYDGAVAANGALVRSLNVPFVRLLREYGVDDFLTLLRAMGLLSLDKQADHYGLSLILGGAESTMWELTSMYCSMAQVLNTEHESAAPFIPLHTCGSPAPRTGRFPLGAAAIWQTFETLLDANRPEELDWRMISTSRKVAWKTGTSFGFRDGWAIGITPQYAVAVWVGNATGEGRPGLTGGATAARVMFDLFTLLPPTGWFETPYGKLKEVEICAVSGHEAGANCPVRKTILTADVNTLTAVCPYHINIYLSEDGRYRLFRECSEGRPMVAATWFVLPPVQESYYKHTSAQYRSLPPLSPRCLSVNAQSTMAFVYPDAGAKIKLAKQMDGSEGMLIAQVAHHNPDAVLYWHLDDQFIGTTSRFHQQAVRPEQGSHLLTVVDDAGNSIYRKFEVE